MGETKRTHDPLKSATALESTAAPQARPCLSKASIKYLLPDPQTVKGRVRLRQRAGRHVNHITFFEHEIVLYISGLPHQLHIHRPLLLDAGIFIGTNDDDLLRPGILVEPRLAKHIQKRIAPRIRLDPRLIHLAKDIDDLALEFGNLDENIGDIFLVIFQSQLPQLLGDLRRRQVGHHHIAQQIQRDLPIGPNRYLLILQLRDFRRLDEQLIRRLHPIIHRQLRRLPLGQPLVDLIVGHRRFFAGAAGADQHQRDDQDDSHKPRHGDQVPFNMTRTVLKRILISSQIDCFFTYCTS